MRASSARRGFSAVEMIIALVIVAVVTACLLIAIPNSRERSRRAGCQANLRQIGLALALYHQTSGHWPAVTLDASSPIAAMLETLGQPDFAALRDPKVAPARRLAGPVKEHVITGLLCPTDRDAMDSPFPGPVSYRANTGDTSDGQGGPFAIGRVASIGDVEAADGTSYTAAFSERLVGEGKDGIAASWAYALVPGPIGVTGCPTVPPSAWRGDAGSSWLRSDWRSTLYSHAALPAANSCVADDQRTALVGASSEHPEGVHVLLLDGSLRTYRPTVAAGVWRGLGTIGGPPR